MTDAPPRAPSLSAQLRSISGRLGALPTGARARLRRMDPERPGSAIGDVVTLLIAAGVPEGWWSDSTGTERGRAMADERLIRWARVCHLAATLSGAAGREAHAPEQEYDAEGQKVGDHHPERRAGRAIHAASVSEARLLRLTAARGPALAAQMRRIARHMAARAPLPADLTPLAELLLWEGRNEERADRARLRLARGYYGAARAVEKTEMQGAETTE